MLGARRTDVVRLRSFDMTLPIREHQVGCPGKSGRYYPSNFHVLELEMQLCGHTGRKAVGMKRPG